MSQAQPRVLWVTEEPPDRSLGGGSIRQAYLFEALAESFPTDLLLAGCLGDDNVRDAAAMVTEFAPRRSPRSEHPVGRRALELGISLGSRLPVAAYPAGPNRRLLARELSDRRGRYALVCVEHESLAPLVGQRGPEPWLLTFHHVLSGMIEMELELAPGRRQRWFRRRELDKARRLERQALTRFDRCITCSPADAERLSRLVPAGSDSVSVIPNGVDLGRIRPTPLPAQPLVLFPASLDYPPNVDAALWLAHEIWPQIRERMPEARLLLVGRSPRPVVRELDRRPDVTVQADVLSMVPYFEAARVVVVPLRVGTGTRLKALEAMAAGRPVVGTSVGMEGIGATDRVDARIADLPGELAAAIADLLRDDEAAAAMARAGRTHVERHFGWDAIGARLVSQAQELMRAPCPPSRTPRPPAG